MGHLDHLWAGWRSDFVSGAGGAAGAAAADGAAGAASRATGCVFCSILSSGLADAETNIVWRHPGGHVLAILNAYPYTSGHLMAMPLRHVADLEDLSASESAELWQAVTYAVRALKAAYHPEGVNVGANLGRAAGAGVPGHCHVHVVARWVGDTNFMTAVADARVLPEPLTDSAAKLRACWPASR